MKYEISLNLPHINNDLQLKIYHSDDTNNSDEHFAIDNLKISIPSEECPEISLDLGESFSSCNEYVIIDGGNSFDSYLWSNGDTSQTTLINETGIYSLEVENHCSDLNYVSLDGEGDYIKAIDLPHMTTILIHFNHLNLLA